MHKARVVRLQFVDQRHERSDGTAHRDQALCTLIIARQALKIGGELLARPRGGNRELAVRGRQRREKPLRHATATDVQRARSLQRKDPALRSVYARRELRGATARIGDDNAFTGKVVRHAKKCQACLDLARNHLRFKPQLAQAVQQQCGVGRIARGTRAGGADARGPKGARLVHKHAACGEHALDRRLAKAARRVHALAQVGDLGMLERFHDRPGLDLRQHQSRRHRSQVDRGHLISFAICHCGLPSGRYSPTRRWTRPSGPRRR